LKNIVEQHCILQVVGRSLYVLIGRRGVLKRSKYPQRNLLAVHLSSSSSDLRLVGLRPALTIAALSVTNS
jgi:hypothetical protein